MKPLIVLDTSTLKGAHRGLLTALSGIWEFLLLEILLHEVGTHRMSERSTMGGSGEAALDQAIESTFRRAIDEAGNTWLLREKAFQCEIETGQSARNAERDPLRGDLRVGELSLDQKRDCIQFDLNSAALVGDAPSLAELGNLHSKCPTRPAFFDWLSSTLTTSESIRTIQKRAFAIIHNHNFVHDLTRVSLTFMPATDWVTYGLHAASDAICYFSNWAHRSGQQNPHRATNLFRDLEYVAYVSIADGLLSSDKNQLSFAWALWPQKRRHLYYFNNDTQRLNRFSPC